ncbi:MAG: potassium channel protein [Bacteroidota bacterium]
MLPRLPTPIEKRIARLDDGHAEVVIGAMLLASMFVVGTVGYMLIEGWSWLDAFYMTFITLSTIGFSEVGELSPLGRLFTVAIALVGIGVVAFMASRAIQYLVATQRYLERRMQRRIDALSDHYVICGYGRLGQRIADDLRRSGLEIVVIDRSLDRTLELQEAGYLYVHGDAEQEDTLVEAGIHRASGLVLTLPEDASNVFTSLTAKGLQPALFVLARTDHHPNMQKLLRAGVDKVISPYEIGADRMSQVILRPNVDRFMEQVMNVSALDLEMEEVEIEPGAMLDGMTLASSRFRSRFDVIVVAVSSQLAEAALTSDIDSPEPSLSWQFNPQANSLLSAGDVLIVLGSPTAIDTLRREGCATDSSEP